MFKVCLANRIVRREKDYKCFLCHCEDIENKYEAVKEHLKQWRHKKLLKEMDKSEREKEMNVIELISETQRKILVENYIAIAGRRNEKYRCYMCASYLSSLPVVFEHLKTFIHQTNYKQKFSNILVVKNNDEKIASVSSGRINRSFFFEKEYWCTVCQIPLKKFSLIKCHAMAHLFQKNNLKQDDVIYFHYEGNDVTKITCLFCKKSMHGIENLEDHLNSSGHVSGISYLLSNVASKIKCETELDIKDTAMTSTLSQYKELEEYVTVKNIYCKVCTVVIPELDFEKHIHDKDHYNKAALQILEGAYKLKDPKPKKPLDNTRNYICFVCNRTYPTPFDIMNHFSGTKHKSKILALYKYLNEIDGQRGKHRNAYESQENLKMITPSIDDVDLACLSLKNTQPEFEKLNCLRSNKIVPLKNSLQNKSIQADSNNVSKQNLLLPRNRKPRKPKTKTIFQFDQNLSSFGNTFINMCIEAGDRNIYNNSEEMDHLLSLSTKLIVPIGPVLICIPCADEITNNEFSIYEHLYDSKHCNNIYKLKVDDQLFLDYPDQFSDLKLAKAHMQEESDHYVYCYACSVKVSNVDNNIRQHLMTNEHILISKSLDIESEEILNILLTITKNYWYYAHFFICEICSLSFNMELEFIIHIKSKKHLQNLNEIKLKNIATKFHMCPTCVTCWYGVSDSFSNHIEDSLHKHLIDSGRHIVPSISLFINGILNEPVKNIKYLISESDKTNSTISEEAEDEELLWLNTIELTVKGKYPKAKAHLFGSRLSYLGFLTSDFNVYLDCEDMYYKSISKEKNEQYLLMVKNIITNQSRYLTVENTVFNKTIPFITVSNVNSNQLCNIFFKSGLDVEKSKLVRNFNIAVPLCRELILYFKKWSDLCRLTELNSITTYTISWFVIFLLQIKGILPSIHQLIKIKNKSMLVDGWECGFEEKIPVVTKNSSFLDLVKEFFLYYADFDFKSCVMCPYLGKTIKKSCFANIEQLPDQMNVYQNRIIKNEVQLFRFDSPMCIQDPIDHSDNITKTVTKFQMQQFMQSCAESLEKLNC